MQHFDIIQQPWIKHAVIILWLPCFQCLIHVFNPNNATQASQMNLTKLEAIVGHQMIDVIG